MADNEYCDWFAEPKFHSNLDEYITARAIPGSEQTFCSNDRQVINVSYLMCVNLSDIEIPEVWNPSRVEAIRRWATPDTLRRLKYFLNKDNEKILDKFNSPPRVYRGSVNINKPPTKFEVSDGIHRINVAKELGLDCILCEVTEEIKIDKEDISNYNPATT